MQPFPSSVTCCYLYIITKYGYPPPAGNTRDYLEQMRDLGFSSVELEGIRSEHLMDMYEQRFAIKETLASFGQTIPYFCAVLPGLGSENPDERKLNLQLFEKGCEIAALLGSKGILDNAPLPPYRFPADIPVVRHYEEDILLSAGFTPGLNWKKYWKDLVETYQRACDIAGEKGLSYQMHPCAGVLSATTDAFLYFADAVDRPNLRFNFDTANQFFLKDNLTLSLMRLADHIDYIHISDNGGKRVEHLVPGQGIIEWDLFFATLKDIGFNGHYGVDVGGAESGIEDIDKAYIDTAEWIQQMISKNR